MLASVVRGAEDTTVAAAALVSAGDDRVAGDSDATNHATMPRSNTFAPTNVICVKRRRDAFRRSTFCKRLLAIARRFRSNVAVDDD